MILQQDGYTFHEFFPDANFHDSYRNIFQEICNIKDDMRVCLRHGNHLLFVEKQSTSSTFIVIQNSHRPWADWKWGP